jgi:N-acetylglucosamine-6-phosphate deacetylase
MITPTFFDLQVNGYGGIDFNQDDLTAEGLHAACECLRSDRVGGILATIITDELDTMARRLENLVRLREQDPLAKSLIQGLHIEGPFLSPLPGYRGAHPVDAIRPASQEAMKRLLEAGGGLTRLVTLAPEQDERSEVIRMLVSQRIHVSAGHTDASVEQLQAALDAGLMFFTHLGNGCPTQFHRHDNIVQRALSLAERLWTMMIADGAHVPFFALRNYLRLTGTERAIVVSDGISATGLGPGRYTLGRWDLLIGEDMIARAPDNSHLVGSATPMKRAFTNLIEQAGLTEQKVIQLTCVNPRKALGIAT